MAPALLRWLLLSAFAAAAGGAAGAQLPASIGFQPMFAGSGVFLSEPVLFAEMPGRPRHYLVLEQAAGLITLIRPEGEGWREEEFLRVDAEPGGEMGVLGLAFHPRFTENRKYYLNWNPRGASSTYVDEREARPDFRKDSGRIRRLLRIAQPAVNHNGGTLAFGPRDGLLYVGMGDGGAGPETSQAAGSVLGKFLRLDVDAASPRPEIWASGLRNPWKWSFDPLTGELWAADVGGTEREELSIVTQGANLGWPIWEGSLCRGEDCSGTGFTAPFADWERNDFTVIIGGRVYRGNPASPYHGVYFFANHDPGAVWALRRRPGGAAPEARRVALLPTSISSIDADASGNLYAVGHGNGTIYRLLIPPDVSVRPPAGRGPVSRARLALEHGRPWPAPAGDYARLDIFSRRGERLLAIAAAPGLAQPPLPLPRGWYIARAAGLRGTETWSLLLR